MFGIIINQEGYKVEFVALEDGKIQFYNLKDDEEIITQDWQIANAMGKPHWTGTEWVDEEPPKQIDNCTPKPTTDEEIASLKEQVLELSDMIILMSQQ